MCTVNACCKILLQELTEQHQSTPTTNEVAMNDRNRCDSLRYYAGSWISTSGQNKTTVSRLGLRNSPQVSAARAFPE